MILLIKSDVSVLDRVWDHFNGALRESCTSVPDNQGAKDTLDAL